MLVCTTAACGGGTDEFPETKQQEEDPVVAVDRADRARRLSLPETDPAYERLFGSTLKLSVVGDELIATDPDGGRARRGVPRRRVGGHL